MPCGGVIRTGSGELGSSQRLGLNSRESGPHVEGRVCKAIVLMYAPNGPASEKVRSPSFSVWLVIASRNMSVTGGKRRAASNCEVESLAQSHLATERNHASWLCVG